MSDYLLSWINDDVGLSKKIRNIPKEFYNGYYFGELLFKLDIINENEFQTNFLNTKTYEDIKRNFHFLKQFLLNIDMDLPTKSIKPMIEQNLTAAASVLYKIRKSIDRKKINFNNIVTSQDGVKKNDIGMHQKILNMLDGKDSRENTIENDRYSRTNEKALRTKTKIDTIIQQKTNLEVINDDQVDSNNVIISSEAENKKEEEKEKRKSKSVASSYDYHRNAVNQMLNKDNEEEKKFSFQVFNESLNRMGFDINVQKMNMLNGRLNFDMSQDVIMAKIKEQLKERLETKKQNNLKTSKQIKEELSRNFYNKDISPDEINFLKREKNPLIPKRIFCTAFTSFSIAKKNNSQTFRKRLEYERNYNLTKKNQILSQRINYFKSLILKPKSQQRNVIKLKQRETEEQFNSGLFFTALDGKSLSQSIIESQEKISKKTNDFPLMRNILYQIIEMAEEGYKYQKETKQELLSLEMFKEWNHLFVNNIPLNNEEEDMEAKQIRQASNDDEEKIDSSKIQYTEEEEKELLDYLKFVGNWDDKKLIPDKEKNKKINYELIVDDYKPDYEPTTEEMDDATVPKEYVTDYEFGEIIDGIIDMKIAKEALGKEAPSNEGKWDYIPFKLCLIGYPLSGKKTLAKKINEKYSNIKVYNLLSILQELINEWNTINAPIENHPKFKSMKKNQIEQLKNEKQAKIEQFKPKYEIIKSYIENTEENKVPLDELLFTLLKYKVEEDFPKDQVESNKEKIIKRQTQIKTLEQNLNVLKEQNATSKKPKLKEEQQMQKEIDSLKAESYSGFIVTDYLQNYKQCLLLEHYLTGYIDEASRPKSEKSILMEKLSYVIDQLPKKEDDSLTRKSGIDFVINMNTPLESIKERYEKIQYDPVTNIIYTTDELSSLKLDKKINERLVKEIPGLDSKGFENKLNNYSNNFMELSNFYSPIIKDDNKVFIDINCNEYNSKELITEYVDNNILSILYNHQEKKEKEILNNSQPQEGGSNEPNNQVIQQQLNNSTESNETEKDIVINLDMPQRKFNTKKIGSLMEKNEPIFEKILNDMLSFTDKYTEKTKFFFYQIHKQRNDIITRINLIQKQFMRYLNKKTQKSNLLQIYVNKYNDFYTNNNKLMTAPAVINEFNKDISNLNDNLWLLVRDKQTQSISELSQIKSSGFIENEIKKFYSFIVEQFKIETDKFLTFTNIIIKYYAKNNYQIENDFFDNYTCESILDLKNKLTLIEKGNRDTTLYIDNIEQMYLNCFNLIFKLNDYIKEIENSLKASAVNESFTTVAKKKSKKKTVQDNANVTINTSNTKGVSNTFGGKNTIEDIKLKVKIEKTRFKFRITLIKNFATSYIKKVYTFTNEVYEKLDHWIILSVSKQNDRINELIIALRDILDKKIQIPETKKDDNLFDIELDDFSKEENLYDSIDAKSIIEI